MKNSRAVVAMVAIALVVAIGAMAGRTANAAHLPTVGLGTADSFAVLAGAGITNTGSSVINGNIGSHGSSTAITGFPPGTVNGTNHGGDGVTQGAKAALVTAYNDAAGRTPATTVPTELGGTTLTHGVYTSAAGTFGITGALTLNAEGNSSAVFIFQMASTLTTATASSVVLIGGAQSCNIFWQVGSSATIDGSTTFRGNILALTSITLVTSATVDGRLLARNGAVSLDTNTITRSTCAAPAPIPPTRPPFTVAPSATPTVAPTATPIGTTAPTATPIGGATPAVAPTATPGAAATPVVAVAQRLPSTSTGDPFGPLLMLGIALMGTGVLVLRRQIRNS